MLVPIEGIADKSLAFMGEQVKKDQEIDLKPLVQGFALDSISKVAFGMETNCHRYEDKEFFDIARQVFEQFTTHTWTNTFLFNFLMLFPELLKKMGFWPEAAIKIRNMTKDIMQQRDEKNISVGDFVDRLREFKKVAQAPITSEMIEAQGMVFLTAGFETTSNTIGALLYYITTNSEVQEQLVEEINRNIGSEEITHEAIASLDFLEACIMETLRIHPPVIEHDRTCVKDCIVNGIPIKKGVSIQLPIYAAHYNPDFFPEPHVFKPERFLKENEDQIIPYTWRPFGSGNRVCIGQRFALMEIKLYVAKLLAKFKLSPTPKTKLECPIGSGFLMYYDNMFIKLAQRN